MKTTINIGDELLHEIKQLAAQRQTTVTALIEAALRDVLSQAEKQSRNFRLKKRTFKGQGLQEGPYTWPEWRQKIYEGQGG